MRKPPKNIVAIGATSSIAQHALRYWARGRCHMILVARNEEKLKQVAQDLAVRGATVRDTVVADLKDATACRTILRRVRSGFPRIDLVFVAHGLFGQPDRASVDVEAAEEILEVNFLSVVRLLTPLGRLLEAQRHGQVAVISSVAGDRGRQSNYVYGAAKAGLTVFLQGLRNRLFFAGVSVTTIKPGYVDTPMTAHMNPNRLFADPEKVGRGICRAVEKRKDVVYLPPFWFWIMKCIQAIPEAIFKRLRL